MKAVLCKSTNNCYFRKCFIRHYQSCTSKQSSFLVLLACSNASQTEFLLVSIHVKRFTALRWYILFYTRHILILTATFKKLNASHQIFLDLAQVTSLHTLSRILAPPAMRKVDISLLQQGENPRWRLFFCTCFCCYRCSRKPMLLLPALSQHCMYQHNYLT